MTTGIAAIFLALISPVIALIYLTQGSVGVEEFMHKMMEDILPEASNSIISLINSIYSLF